MVDAKQTKLPSITFGESGIETPHDDTERVALTAGMIFIATRAEIRPSKKYTEYAVFDGETIDGEEFHAYTASGVILSQAKTMVEKYGTEGGALSAAILCAVESRVSQTTGRTFLTLA